MKKITKTILKDIYKERPVDAKKYDFGLLTVIGGSDFYSGSPALTALAAFRSGCDMVRIIAPKRSADIIASFSPNLAAYPLEGKILESSHLSTILTMIESCLAVSNGKTAVVIGGGTGRSLQTQKVICDFLSQISVPTVIDADAIHALARQKQVITDKPFLITPHTYEFYILTGRKVRDLSEKEKIIAVQEEAAKLKTTILLKGSVDIISNGKEVALNELGSPYLTVGGTGDTLAGICGALLARGIDPFLAAQAGALINSLAGRIASKEFGESMMATDLINSIPKAIRQK